MTEEYEILPHKLISDLKFDVEALKKKLTQPDAKANELILEIESLKDSIHELTTIFQKSLETIQGEGDITKTILVLNQRLDTVVTQNETIAKGMIAISDKLEDFMSKNVSSNNVETVTPATPTQHSMGMPSITGGPSRMAPPPITGSGNPQMRGMAPPSPPSKAKRQGIFK